MGPCGGQRAVVRGAAGGGARGRRARARQLVGRAGRNEWGQTAGRGCYAWGGGGRGSHVSRWGSRLGAG